MLTASDAGGTSPVAVNPVGYEEAEVRKFSQRLFVLSASVKQASGALAPVQAQTLRDSRLDLLRRVEGFASGGAALWQLSVVQATITQPH